jgi:hypothetical protein
MVAVDVGQLAAREMERWIPDERAVGEDRKVGADLMIRQH